MGKTKTNLKVWETPFIFVLLSITFMALAFSMSFTEGIIRQVGSAGFGVAAIVFAIIAIVKTLRTK